MKKTISIFFISIYLLAATEAPQLLKLPAIFAHYAAHKKDNKDAEFLSFFHTEYLNATEAINHIEGDTKLPSKKITVAVSTISHICQAPPSALSIVCPVNVIEPVSPGLRTFSPTARFLPIVWQPPRHLL